MNLCRAYFGVPGHQGEIQCRLKVIELAVHAPQLRADTYEGAGASTPPAAMGKIRCPPARPP